VISLVATIASVIAVAGASTASSAVATPSWSEAVRLPGVRSLAAVSCPSRGFCMAVGNGEAVAYKSGHWRTAKKIDSHGSQEGGLLTVSCVSASFCLAGDGDGYAFVYHGASWSRPRLVAPAGFAEISCSAASFCGALDTNGDALFFDRSRWSARRLIPNSSQPLSISCVSGRFCMALDGTSTSAWRLTGGHWLAAGSLGVSTPMGGSEPNTPSAVGCSGRKFCAALDDFGDAFTWAHGKWSRADRFDPNLEQGSGSVSCPANDACAAVDSNGLTTRWDGQTWSSAQQIDSQGGDLQAISCATAWFCAAVDGRGRVLTYDVRKS
jgi:hypothetical protein